MIATTLLLIVGVQLWLVLSHGSFDGYVSVKILAVTLIVALIPPINRKLAALFDFLRRHPHTATGKIVVAVVIWAVATWYFNATVTQQRLLRLPRIHDESSYLIQTRMLMRGRLWMPQHPLADFFESFHILVKPVYASKYFPGAAMLYAPGLEMGLPYWFLPTLIGGAVVAMTFIVIARLTDNLGGGLAALMMLANSDMRRAATLFMSTSPMLLLSLVGFWCYLNWLRKHQLRWIVAIGFVFSWAAITRPLDAVCFAVPIGIHMLIRMASMNWRARLTQIGCLLAAAIPCLSIQLIADVGITGHFLTTPWSYYARHDDPYDGMAIGRLDLTQRPQTVLPQKIEFSDTFTRKAAIDRRAPGRMMRWLNKDLPNDLETMLPHAMMIILLPVSLLGLIQPPRRTLAAAIALLLLSYALYTFAFQEYLVMAAPAMTLLIVSCVETLMLTWPKQRNFIAAFLIPTLIGWCIVQLPQVNHTTIDDVFRPVEQTKIHDALSRLPNAPCVVLFRYSPIQSGPHFEPVYNIETAWPDDARIIRAHDLGSRNVEIFRYYAEHQPQRAFYLYDRGDDSIRYLGLARDLGHAD